MSNRKDTSEAALTPLCTSVDGVAKALGVSLSSAKMLVASNAIRSIRLGRRVLIPISAISDYIERALSAERVA